jgi:hypothetical protein
VEIVTMSENMTEVEMAEWVQKQLDEAVQTALTNPQAARLPVNTMNPPPQWWIDICEEVMCSVSIRR